MNAVESLLKGTSKKSKAYKALVRDVEELFTKEELLKTMLSENQTAQCRKFEEIWAYQFGFVPGQVFKGESRAFIKGDLQRIFLGFVCKSPSDPVVYIRALSLNTLGVIGKEVVVKAQWFFSAELVPGVIYDVQALRERK